MWGALVTDGKEWEIIKPQEIGVFDRVGGADGFVCTMLYGILWRVGCPAVRSLRLDEQGVCGDDADRLRLSGGRRPGLEYLEVQRAR